MYAYVWLCMTIYDYVGRLKKNWEMFCVLFLGFMSNKNKSFAHFFNSPINADYDSDLI